MDPTLEDDGLDESTSDAPETIADSDEGSGELSLRDVIKNAAAGKDSSEDEEAASVQAGRARDEKGRFVSGERAPTDAPAEQQDLSAQGETATEESTAEMPDAIQVPRSWAAEDADHFRALPPDTQRRIAEKESKRDSLFNQNHQQLNEAIRLNQGIGPVIQPYTRDWQLRGIDPAQAVQRLLSFDEYCRGDAEGAIRWLAAENQVDLRQLSEGQPPVAPQQSAHDERISRLEQSVEATRRGLVTQAHQQTVGFVNSWGAEKDANGNDLRPHFEDLREDMSVFVPTLEQKYPNATPQELLDRAYRLALADRPDLQKVVQQSAEQKRIADAKAKAERARKASSSIPSSYNGNSHVVPADDLRSVIVAAVNQHRA